MKLGILSDCIHYRTADGRVGTENHILLRQLQQLCSHFSATLICCPFAPLDDKKVISTYTSSNISFSPLPVVGGETVKAKLQLAAAIPLWWNAYRKVDKHSDIVYQRFPNNLNIPAFFYFLLKKKKVFATYTGTWKGYEGEAFTYKMQRLMLERWFRGPVWVYDEQARDNSRIKPGFSPSYSIAEWHEETEQVNERLARLRTATPGVYRFITVGTLIDYKNQLAIVKACAQLKKHQFPFSLTIVGDGPMRQEIEDYVKANDLQEQVILAGKKDQAALRRLYRQHDFVIQAPLKEGFGKVPVEGFFHGVIPIINNISLAKQMMAGGDRGFLFDAGKPNDLAETLLSLPARNHLLPAMIENGRKYAQSQTLEAWAKEYYETVRGSYHEV